MARVRRPLSVNRSYQNPSKQMSYFDQTYALSMDDAIARFLSIKESMNLRPKTIVIYRKYLKYFNEWLKQNRPEVTLVDEVTRKIIEEYLRHSVASNLSPYTVNGRLRMIKTFYNALIDDGEKVKNPAEKIPYLKTNSTKLRVYTDEQVQLLLDYCDTRSYVGLRDYTYLLLALDTGMRVNETLLIKVSDVDFDSRIISIDGSNAKSRKSRTVPFSSFTGKYLRELVSENGYHFEGMEYLFISIRGQRLSQTALKNRLLTLGELSGVGKEISVTCHNFRHTAATNMLKAGMDLYTLSRILGHSNINMTKRYLSLDSKDLSQRHEQFSPVQQFRTRKRRF
ncbi:MULTISPECIES: tyrosine-type recombinase/integrase [Exiguobacterium]|uniref:tyrosine-type recombinase/integrase n=1 Tax=Exiguobacterium TaxID=33986 RepID=UPI001BE659C9|nr:MULTISPECIES: tyrosine-type recombinase/integrase [Exiguobacterium]MCT4792859.1 tyrosine-type recombinase/integrase [Exiguobacterium artemiae]